MINKKNHNFLKIFLIFFLLIFTAKPIPILFSPFSVFIPLTISILLFIYEGRKLIVAKRNLIPFLVFVGLCFAYIFKFKDLDLLFISYFFALILTIFLTLKLIDLDFFVFYEKLVFILASISLVLFTFQLIQEQSLIDIMKQIQTFLGINNSVKSQTIILFTINHNNSETIRNCGFAWEPGPFAIFLNIAILIRLLVNQVRVDNHIIIYIICIITTFSTTGYLAFFILVFWFFYIKNTKAVLLAFPVLLTFSVISFNKIPFLKEKIYNEYYSSENKLNAALVSKSDQGVSIGRFPGLLLNFEDFKRNPIIGYGGQIKEQSTSSQIGPKVTSTSGLGNWLSQFGIVGVLLLFIAYFKSLKSLLGHFRKKGVLFIFLVFIIFGFSFNILNSPIFFSFMLWSNFRQSKNPFPLF